MPNQYLLLKSDTSYIFTNFLAHFWLATLGLVTILWLKVSAGSFLRFIFCIIVLEPMCMKIIKELFSQSPLHTTVCDTIPGLGNPFKPGSRLKNISILHEQDIPAKH